MEPYSDKVKRRVLLVLAGFALAGFAMGMGDPRRPPALGPTPAPANEPVGPEAVLTAQDATAVGEAAESDAVAASDAAASDAAAEVEVEAAPQRPKPPPREEPKPPPAPLLEPQPAPVAPAAPPEPAPAPPPPADEELPPF